MPLGKKANFAQVGELSAAMEANLAIVKIDAEGKAQLFSFEPAGQRGSDRNNLRLGAEAQTARPAIIR